MMTLAPLHSRTISLHLTYGGPSTVVVEGRILDLRKRRVVTPLGRIRPPGVVHDMTVRLELDWPELRVRTIQPVMSTFPFPASAETDGNGCPQALPAVQQLVGASLRDEYMARLTRDIGGTRSCFHILTLLRPLGAAMEAFMEGEQTTAPPVILLHQGQPLFSRTILIDGVRSAPRRITLSGVLFDSHWHRGAGGAGVTPPVERTLETAVELELAVPGMEVLRGTGRARHWFVGGQTAGDWAPLELVTGLVGHTMHKGYAAHIDALVPATAALDPLRHLLFMAAPAALQCLPPLADELDSEVPRPNQTGLNRGLCYMFRPESPLASGRW